MGVMTNLPRRGKKKGKDLQRGGNPIKSENERRAMKRKKLS